MKIQNFTNAQTSFGAFHIANATNTLNSKKTTLEFWELTKDDQPFIKELKVSVNFEKLMPKMKKEDIDIWKTIFHIAINQVTETRKTGILETINQVPCGLMAFSEKLNGYHLDSICTWPIEPQKKVPLAGKSLFSVLFDDFLKSNSKKIELDAVSYSPFSPVTKYSQLGFKQTGGENGIIAMRILREDVLKSFDKLNKIIKLKTINYLENKNFNLFELTNH